MARGLLPPDGVAILALAAPAVAVAWAGLSPGWAAAASAGAVVVSWAVLRRPLFDIRELMFYVRRLAGRGEPAMPTMKTLAGRELVSVLSRMHERLSSESRQNAALAASHGATLDSLPDPLLLVDDHRRVVGANIAVQALLERNPMGADLAAALRVPAVLDAADNVLAGDPTAEAEFALGDQAFAVGVKRLPSPGVGGARLVVALHDITAAKRSERMRAEFVANASHELRTPLASLQGFIETLAGPAKDDANAREQFLPIMLQSANRMSRLIEDLLSLSRIEFDEHSLPKDVVDAVALAHSVIEGLRPQAEARRMGLVLDVALGLPKLRAQADQLAQVLQNLIDNAIKYGREGSDVTVSIQPDGQFVAIAVRDRGEGIERQHLPRLTERFYRCDAARSREMGGTGLGLAIVKHIVNRHRGTLHIDSTLGEGSVFTVRIPAAGL